MHQISPELFRKILLKMKENELRLLAILYETEDYVSDSILQWQMGLNAKQLGNVFAWFKIRVQNEGGSMPNRSDCFPNREENGEWHYRLIDHLRPVAGEFLMKEQIRLMRDEIDLMREQIEEIRLILES